MRQNPLREPTFWAVWATAAAVFALDRVTKAWAVETIAPIHSRPLLDDWVRLTFVRNPGVAFGLGADRALPFAAITIVALVLVLVLALSSKSRTWPRSLALGLIVGGASGNLLDRLRWGSVIDFIDFGYRRNWWPVFNAADSAISIGVIIYAWTLLFAHETHSDAPEEAPARDPDTTTNARTDNRTDSRTDSFVSSPPGGSGTAA